MPNGKLDLKEVSGFENKNLEAKDVIYIYIGNKNVYIGQTKNLKKRHLQHLSKQDSNFNMNNYQRVICLLGELVNKNLDYLEKKLITLFVTDNEKGKKVEIDNKTVGNHSNHYQDSKELDSLVIVPFWEDELNNLGCVNNKEVSYLKKGILAKYSPFMELTDKQEDISEEIINNKGNYIIEGASGTGKTVLMTNIVAKLFDNYNGTKNIGVVVKANWRKNAKIIFENYGINENITVGTWGALVNSGTMYDYILVDEAHRLPRFYGKLHPSERGYFNGDTTKNSLELLNKVSNSLILFYDRYQSIRPSDIPTSTYDTYIETELFKKIPLAVQFRIHLKDEKKSYTADDYIKGIRYILQLSDDKSFDKTLFNNNDKDSYFGFANSIQELFEYTNRMNHLIDNSQNRVIAGYTREWVSKKNKDEYDWIEKDNKWRWNTTHEDWMNKKNSKEEIGSIHAVQGIDINCVGLIIGKDLTFQNGKVVGVSDNYYDKNGKPIKNEFNDESFTDFLKNIYYTLMTRGIDGIRIYIEDKELRDYFMNQIVL